MIKKEGIRLTQTTKYGILNDRKITNGGYPR